jgi:nicotinamidase-related amidase
VSPHLVVVDLQHVFADPDSQWHAPRFAATLAPVQRLVDAYPSVTFTRFVAPDTPSGAWVDYYEQWPFALQPPDADLYALVPPFTGRATLDLPTFGKWGPQLESAGSDELVVCGVSTDCCVISTVLAAADAGARVTVVADACAGATDESHQQALAIMTLYAPLVRVTTCAELLA